MKKIGLVSNLVLVLLICISFASCGDNVDVIKGVWKCNMKNMSTSGSVGLTYIFDGKGNFTLIDTDANEEIKGTYTIGRNENLGIDYVHVQGIIPNNPENRQNYEYTLTLDLNSTPPTLTQEVFNVGTFVFTKQ